MEKPGNPISVAVVSLGAVALIEPHSDFPVGGAELQCHLLAKRLAQEPDFLVTLYVADLGQPPKKENRLLIRPLTALTKTLRLTPGKALAVIRQLASERHLIYITRSASGLNGLVSLAARRAAGRYLHMCAHDNEASGQLDATLSFLARKLHNLAISRADSITCQTPAQRTALRSRYGREAAIIPNLIPPADPHSPEPRAGALWVGRDVEWKRPELFLQLAHRIRNHPFTMICQPQPDRHLARLRDAAPDNLKLIPGLPFDETNRLFAAHQVFVCTSAAEGYPNTFLQAAAAGTPILSLTVDPGQSIRRHNAGIVCDNDLDRLVAATEELLEKPDVWREYHAGAKAWAAAHANAENPVIPLIRSLAHRAVTCAE